MSNGMCKRHRSKILQAFDSMSHKFQDIYALQSCKSDHDQRLYRHKTI